MVWYHLFLLFGFEAFARYNPVKFSGGRKFTYIHKNLSGGLFCQRLFVRAGHAPAAGIDLILVVHRDNRYKLS
ncbi:MAG: hypothetical protein DSY90_15345 [Deltaproteobacteria bacterium]|nr:MAG: hypothetical protein DSY90_15345 [Deltaproteobacteria bacterium]